MDPTEPSVKISSLRKIVQTLAEKANAAEPSNAYTFYDNGRRAAWWEAMDMVQVEILKAEKEQL